MSSLILNAFINGILLGGVFAVLAFGLNLIFGVVKIIHLAYGQFVMAGMYMFYVFVAKMGLNYFLAGALTVVGTGIGGLIVHFLIVRPLQNAPRLNQLLALSGLIVVLENLALIIFGADYLGVNIFLPVLHVGEIYIRAALLISFVASLVIVGFLYWFLEKTYLGLSVQAVTQNETVANLMGINPKFVYLFTFVLGSALTGIVASLFSLIYSVHPHFGGGFTLTAFVIVILGGMGNVLGGFVGAFIIGIVHSLSAVLINAEVAEIITLTIFVVILIIRPQGILGVRTS